MKRRTHGRLMFLCIVAFLFGSGTSGLAQPPDPLTLRWCLERASEANPDIAVDVAAVEAAEHRVVPAGSLDDPRFTYEAVNVPKADISFRRTPMSGQQLRLSQKFPFPGVLSNRKKAAISALQAASSLVGDRRRRVASAVERAFAQLGFAQRALEITDQNLDLLRQLSRIAETKYRVGTGIQPDVLRAHVEISFLLDERIQREEGIALAEADLSAVLDLPGNMRYPRTEDIAETAPLPQLPDLLGKLEVTSPRLKALAARIEEAESLKRSTAREGYPDFDVGVGYRVRQEAIGDPVFGDDFLSAGITMRFPINRKKWREKVAERTSLVRRTQAQYRALLAVLRSHVRSAFANLVRADDEVALLETGLVPQARQSLESSRASYEVDKVDFLDLIDSQVRLLESELRLVRALADRRFAFADLEAAFGERIR